MNAMDYNVFQQYKNSSWHLPSGDLGGGQTTGCMSQRNRLSDTEGLGCSGLVQSGARQFINPGKQK